MQPHSPLTQPSLPPRHVRICERRSDGRVRFEFSIGDPDLYVELLLETAHFEQFCRDQQATDISRVVHP